MQLFNLSTGHSSLALSSSELKFITMLSKTDLTVFIHGSHVTSQCLNENSDIDLCIIGDPLRLRTHKILNSMSLNMLASGEADYLAIKGTAWSSSRISLHIQPPRYRSRYLSKPYSLECRQASDVTEIKEYIVCGITYEGNVFALIVNCPRELIPATDVAITRIPQTGIFVVESDSACFAKSYSQQRKFDVAFVHEPKMRKGQEFLLIGLELNKMTEDIPVYPGSSANFSEYVETPLTKCLELIRQTINADCVTVLMQSLRVRSKARTHYHGKPPVSELFFERCEQKLRELEKTVI